MNTPNQVTNIAVVNEKSMLVAYILWFFLGFFSAHRFYTGRTGSAIAQLILNFLVIGLIWTLIDVFLIPGMVRNPTVKNVTVR